MTIHVLPNRVAAQIAAGEVVERPASIVKELVENSTDAGATRISVAIEAGGTRSITVTDDGTGIPPDQVEVAFQRHATSKLSKVEDLLNISTLGFRGEALPSIAAASRLTCVTKTADHDAAIRYTVEFGEAQNLAQCGAPKGTSIKAENLFGYQPARLKFLKTRPTEAAHVQRTVARYALAHPEIRFSYTSEGNTQFQTSGNGRLLDVVLELMGPENASQMLPLLHTQDDIAVEGYTSNTSLHRSNRNDIALFVNQRVIQDSDLAWAVEKAYQQSLPQGRHPIAIVLIAIPTEQVDVNAHPTKLEVRFRSSNKVFNAVSKAVADSLSNHGAIHQMSSAPFSGRPRERRAVTPAPPPDTPLRPRDSTGSAGSAERHGETYRQPATRPLSNAQPTPQSSPTTPRLNTTPPPDDTENLREVVPQLKCIGQGQNTYIVADGPQGIYIIDQHAAHERVIYDRTIRQVQAGLPDCQKLLFPQETQLDESQHQSLLENIDLVKQHGFEVQQEGERLWIIHALPQVLTARRSPDPAATLQNLIDEFVAENLIQETSHAMAATIACHAAARAGDRLSNPEMQAIIEQLAETPEPHHCPHGRPTIINVSSHRLEREFRRC